MWNGSAPKFAYMLYLLYLCTGFYIERSKKVSLIVDKNTSFCRIMYWNPLGVDVTRF